MRGRTIKKEKVQDKLLKKPVNRGKAAWLTSGLAQLMVLVNGIIITVTAFMVFSYFIDEMTADEYKRTSNDAGQVLVSSIADIENLMQQVSTMILLSNQNDKGVLVSQIRRNVPNLSNLDQLVWIFEERPGNWQYKTIYDLNRGGGEDRHYRLIPDKALITKLVQENHFSDTALKFVLDFEGMEYTQRNDKPKTMARSFALTKAIEESNAQRGILIGVSRPKLLFDEKLVSGKDFVSRFTVRDVETGRRILHMDKALHQDEDAYLSEYSQNYKISIADSSWEVIMDFAKEQNVLLLQQVPYVILLFGTVLTAVGTLFIRNNSRQSKKLANMNYVLEQKNYELQSEVAERERLNKVLSMAEKDNRAIIDAVSDVIFELDVDGKVLFLSAAWQKITGFDVERSKGSNLFSMLFPEDQEKQKHDFALLVKGQKTAYRSFTRLRISDGTFRAVELAISMIRQDENKALRVVGTITDVEERRRAERALAEAEKKYRTIVENAAGGLYQLTPEGIYLSANPAMARILGYDTPEEMLRMIKNANGAVYPNEQEREKFFNTLLMQGEIFGYETQVLRKDGSLIWVRENIRVVTDENKDVLYFEGSMEDITKRKEADIALMEAKIQSDMANRAKTEFIANMSHELRTPLNAIIGFSDIMKNEVMGPLGQDIYKEYVTDINKSGTGLLKIINEILDISKIEAGNRELNESEFSAQNVLQSCLDLYASRAKEKDLTIMNEAKNMPRIIGEELSIKQVIGNIYSNAIKYTPSGGRITLFTNYDMDGTFRFSVTDTGVGMSAAEVEKALSPFGQIDNALDRSGAGTGLGLPLAQAMMGVHGGRVEILSEKSIGTTVTLVFPAERVVRKEQNETA